MTGPPAPAGPLALTTSVTVRNRAPVPTGPPASVPALVTAGPLDPATSATATGFSISVGYAAPIVAISFSMLS